MKEFRANALHPTLQVKNKVKQRKKCIIKDMDKCVLQNQFIPYKYRGEEVHTSMHLINKSPTKVVHKKTTKEACSK